MGEFEELLANMGIEQWVRNKFVKQLSEYRKTGSSDVDAFVAQFNKAILEDFKVEARKAVNKTLSRASEPMNSTPPQKEIGK